MNMKLVPQACLLVGVSIWIIGFAGSQAAPQSGHPDSSSWNTLFRPDLSNAVFRPGDWVVEGGILTSFYHPISRAEHGV